MARVEELKSDLIRALKGGEKMKTDVLRFLLSELYKNEKDKQGKGELPQLSEEEVTKILQKEYKRRAEAIALFRKGGREDLAEKEEAELVVIKAYLPEQMGKEEIAAVVSRLVAGGTKDFNSLMKETMKELSGKADGRLVAETVKEQIL